MDNTFRFLSADLTEKRRLNQFIYLRRSVHFAGHGSLLQFWIRFLSQSFTGLVAVVFFEFTGKVLLGLVAQLRRSFFYTGAILQ